MINSLRLLFLSITLFLTIGIFAQSTAFPQFSDNDAPIFENTYLIDNIGNNSPGSDVTLRVNKKAPFDCKTKTDCPASVIVSGSTGTVNMPVDVNVKSLFVGKNPVIDNAGRWVGPATGLIGPQGPKGDTGAQGPGGATGAAGPAGPRGADGEGCWFDDRRQRIDCAAGTFIEISALKGPKGDTGATGAAGDGCEIVSDPGSGKALKCGATLTPIENLRGPKGDTGLTGATGPKGDGCVLASDATFGTVIKCGGSITPLENLRGARGPQGIQGVQGVQGPAGSFKGCSKNETTVTAPANGTNAAIASCGTGQVMTGGGCLANGAGGFVKQNGMTSDGWLCVMGGSANQLQFSAQAICCNI